jgi:hypothetical protein
LYSKKAKVEKEIKVEIINKLANIPTSLEKYPERINTRESISIINFTFLSSITIFLVLIKIYSQNGWIFLTKKRKRIETIGKKTKTMKSCKPKIF